MSFFAGAYCRRAGDVLPDSLCAAVERALSRHPDETVQRYRDSRCLLVKADFGAFGEAAFRVTDDAASMLCGEPLFRHEDGVARSRTADLELLDESWDRAPEGLLIRARGVFSAVTYRRKSQSLSLVTDKLGIRPIYYWLDDRYVVFSSALRILEQIEHVPKVMDLRGVTEINAFGFPLGARTPYQSISLMLPAEIIRIEGDRLTHATYWQWDNIPVSNRDVDELARDVYDQFVDAIALRNGGDTTTSAFLSGGMDSRVIVAVLRDRGIGVNSYNFSLPEAQDRVLSAAFATNAGANHIEIPRFRRGPNWSQMMAAALESPADPSLLRVERRRLVWSGDGGSVSLGHVYLNQALVDAARTRTMDELLEALRPRWVSSPPTWLLRPEHRKYTTETTRSALREELSDTRARIQDVVFTFS